MRPNFFEIGFDAGNGVVFSSLYMIPEHICMEMGDRFSTALQLSLSEVAFLVGAWYARCATAALLYNNGRADMCGWDVLEEIWMA